MRACSVGLLLALLLGGRVVEASFHCQSIGELVFVTLSALVDCHVDRPDPVRLLDAGVEGLRGALLSIGIDDRLTSLTGVDELTARARFRTALARAVMLAQGRLEETAFQYAAAAAMAASFRDPQVRFMPPDQFAVHLAQLWGRPGYAGIGAIPARSRGQYYLWYVFAGGPAAQAGLRPFDRVLAANEVSFEGVSEEEAGERVRGPVGSTVRLAVKRPGQTNPLLVSLIRAPIREPSLDYAMLENGIGYARLLGFHENAAVEMQQALQELRRRAMRALVIDLRYNSGGLTGQLDQIADMLLPPGVTAYIRETQQGRVPRVTRGASMLPLRSFVVLVNAETGSAAEMLAASLQDHGRALIVGTRTAGGAREKRDVRLSGGAGVSVVVARILSPHGRALDSGVNPSIIVDLSSRELDRGVDCQFQQAIDTVLRSMSAPPREALGCPSS